MSMSSTIASGLTRSQMKSPYRPDDLITLSSFINYCKDRGVETSREQLEYYDQYNLLIPVALVNHGIVEFRKVLGDFEGKEEWRFTPSDGFDASKYKETEEQLYYAPGGLHIGFTDPITGKDWLTLYEEDGMVRYPWKEEFRPWKEYQGKETSEYFVKSPDDIGDDYEIFYSKDQVFALKEIHRTINIKLSDKLLFDPTADWNKAGANIHKIIPTLVNAAQRNVIWFYELTELLHQILNLREKEYEYFEQEYQNRLEEFGGDEREALQDAKHAVRYYEENSVPELAKVIQNKTKISLHEIAERREHIISLSKWQDPTVNWFDQIETIPGSSLGKSKGIYRLVLDYYNFANHLGWYLELLGKETPTIKKMILGTDNLKTCIVCKNKFVPGDKRQISCSPECTKKNKYDTIKRKRKSGAYKT